MIIFLKDVDTVEQLNQKELDAHETYDQNNGVYIIVKWADPKERKKSKNGMYRVLIDIKKAWNKDADTNSVTSLLNKTTVKCSTNPFDFDDKNKTNFITFINNKIVDSEGNPITDNNGYYETFDEAYDAAEQFKELCKNEAFLNKNKEKYGGKIETKATKNAVIKSDLKDIEAGVKGARFFSKTKNPGFHVTGVTYRNTDKNNPNDAEDIANHGLNVKIDGISNTDGVCHFGAHYTDAQIDLITDTLIKCGYEKNMTLEEFESVMEKYNKSIAEKDSSIEILYKNKYGNIVANKGHFGYTIKNAIDKNGKTVGYFFKDQKDHVFHIRISPRKPFITDFETKFLENGKITSKLFLLLSSEWYKKNLQDIEDLKTELIEDSDNVNGMSIENEIDQLSDRTIKYKNYYSPIYLTEDTAKKAIELFVNEYKYNLLEFEADRINENRNKFVLKENLKNFEAEVSTANVANTQAKLKEIIETVEEETMANADVETEEDLMTLEEFKDKYEYHPDELTAIDFINLCKKYENNNDFKNILMEIKNDEDILDTFENDVKYLFEDIKDDDDITENNIINAIIDKYNN